MARHPQLQHLKIAFWNANGLNDSRDEAEVFVDDHNIDIFLVCETHLRAGQNPRLRNYCLYRADRQSRGGGTAIYIRRSLQHSVTVTPPRQHIEANSVIVYLVNGPIRFTSTYKSPQKPILDSDLDSLFPDSIPTIVAGDLNSKHPSWNSRLTNTSGSRLRAYADQHHLAIYGTLEPTYYSAAGYRPDTIDILIARNVPYFIETASISALNSDHNPVLALINSEPINSSHHTSRRTCWAKFKDTVEANITCGDNISTATDLDDAVIQLTNTISAAIAEATRTTEKPLSHFDIPHDLKELIRQKNRHRRAWQRYGDISARSNMYRLARQIRVELSQIRNEKWAHWLEELSADDNSLWKATKIFRRRGTNIPAPLHGPNGLVHSNADKADVFADRLELQCSPNFEHCDLDHIEEVEATVNQFLQSDNTNPQIFVTPIEVTNIIKHFKIKKAPGPDGISNMALKHLGRKGIVAITNIINSAIRLQHFPTPWKTATVIMIPKPDQNRSFPDNYRPISLLNSISKILERILYRRIESWTVDENIIPDEQHGFRSQHSTNHQLLRVVEYITQGFNRRQRTCALFLDVAKAFDKVWHEGLIFKLLQLRAPTWMIKIIHSYITSRQFNVKVGDKLSSSKYLTAGVPQGSVLSPILFNIYSYDIPKHNNTILTQYADDTAILTKSISFPAAFNRLQAAATELESWYKKWRININTQKSSAITFQKLAIPPDNSSQLSLFNQNIPWSKNTKYLGVVLDNRLNWRDHVTYVLNKARQSSGKLYPLLNKKSSLSLSNKLLLYRAVIRPMMVYAAPIWGYAGSPVSTRLQTFQNKLSRQIVAAPWYVRNSQIHKDLQLDTIEELINKLTVKFFTKVDTHPNASVRAAIEDYELDSKLKYKRPRLALSQ